MGAAGPSIREVSLRALYQFETEGLFVRDALSDLFKQVAFDGRDRSLATELVYGTVRWRKRLDWVLDQLIRRGADSLTPWIRNILRMGVYQLMMMDQVPDAAATDEAVKLAKRYGHKGTVGLTNAVLRSVIRQRRQLQHPIQTGDAIKDMSLIHSYPEWIVQRWIARFGHQQAVALLEAGNRTPPVVIRINMQKISTEKLTELLTLDGVQVAACHRFKDYLTIRNTGDIKLLSGYTEGLFQVQDKSSGLAVRLLDPQPGETIIDVCSAPGGKTTHISHLQQDQGRIIACDFAPKRLRRVRAHCQRLQLENVSVIAMDGCRPGLNIQADRVLVDAPCSGMGTIARRADLRWRRQPEDIPAVQRVQKALLDSSAYLVKTGGTLVYSTCSIETEENEDVLEYFCKRHSEFEVEKPADWHSELSDVMDPQGIVRTLPSRHGIDGSFAVRLRKTG